MTWIQKGAEEAGATFSPCETYRYRLWRVWDPHKPQVSFVMLNPSKATHDILDPTVTRCIRRAQDWGYGGIQVVNLFGLRSTDPAALYQAVDPVGPGNFKAIVDAIRCTQISVCAWGRHGSLLTMGQIIRRRMNEFFPGRAHYLRLNQDGMPAHPLYLPYSLLPTPWSAE